MEKKLVVGLNDKRGCGRNLGEVFRMTNIRYTNAQQVEALEVFDRTQSATKTVRELGYPGRWTVHRCIRQRCEPPTPPTRRTTLKRSPSTTKLKAVELFNSGMSPDAVAAKLSLNSKMSDYGWAQRFREEGKFGMMSATERKQSTSITESKLLWSMHYGRLFAISLRLHIGGLSSRMHSIATIVTQDQQKVMRRTTREHRR